MVSDDTQQDNLNQLDNSWNHMEDAYMSKGNVPPDYIRESHGDLLEEAKELEESKKESWQDQAREEGWMPEGGEEPDDSDNS